MPRRRKASDPATWPEPCGRCAEHHQIAVRWPDGGICGYCYQQAKRTRGTCACGHEGVLPGRVDTLPACRKCSGVRLNIDCIGCGSEDELHSGNRCWACVLSATVDRLLTPDDSRPLSPELQAIATALKSMKRANSGLTWIQQPHVAAFLQQLAATPVITHAVSTNCRPRQPVNTSAASSSNTRPCHAATNSAHDSTTGPSKHSNASPHRTIATSSAATSAGTINAA